MRFRKLSNWIFISGFGLVFFIFCLNPEMHPFEIKLSDGFFGSVCAFLIFLIFYKFGLMGAGDVKFAAALGAWVGWELLLPIWALSCGFAVLHGVVVRSKLKDFFSATMNWEDGRQEKGKRFIPYVTYLSIATVVVLMLNK